MSTISESKLVDQEIEGAQRRDHAAGPDIDVDAESRDTGFCVFFRVGVGRNMALIEMGHIIAALFRFVERMVSLR